MHGHGVLVKDAIKVVDAVEIAEKVQGCQKDNEKREELGGLKLASGIAIQQAESDAEEKESYAGSER